MGLTDKILQLYHKADDFILEKHIEVATWANYNFGTSNYELSTYSVCAPVPLLFVTCAYSVLSSNLSDLPFNSFMLGVSVGTAASHIIINRGLERREQLSLESMTSDPYVMAAKHSAKFWAPLYLGLSAVALIGYAALAASAESPFLLKLSALSNFTLFSGWAATGYFVRVDHKPKKKGRIPAAIENAANRLLRRPAPQYSA